MIRVLVPLFQEIFNFQLGRRLALFDIAKIDSLTSYLSDTFGFPHNSVLRLKANIVQNEIKALIKRLVEIVLHQLSRSFIFDFESFQFWLRNNPVLIVGRKMCNFIFKIFSDKAEEAFELCKKLALQNHKTVGQFELMNEALRTYDNSSSLHLFEISFVWYFEERIIAIECKEICIQEIHHFLKFIQILTNWLTQ